MTLQTDASPDTQVDTLEAKGLIRVATYRPELEYLFRHWLVQDAAYGSLLKQERRQLHREVGEALEALYPDRHGELSGILAMHFEQAGEAQKAIDYYIADARYGLDRNAILESFAAAGAALRLMGPPADDEPEARRRARVELTVLRVRSSLSFRPAEELIAELDSVVDVAEALGDADLAAQVYLWTILVKLENGADEDDPAVRRSTERLEALSETLGDPGLAAFPMAMVAMNKVHTGPIPEGVAALQKAIPLMEHRRDFVGGAFARGWLAIGYAELGDFERAAVATEDAKRKAESGGDLIAQLDAQIADAMVHSIKGDLDGTVPIARACIDRAGETGATACGMVSAWVLGDIQQRSGRFTEADEAFKIGIDLSSGMAEQSWGPTLRMWRKANSAKLGELAAADEGWDEALAGMRAGGNHLGEAGILWKRAETRATQQRWDEAFADFEAAAKLSEAQGARPQLARVLRTWGEALHDAGRREDGDRVLVRAQVLFEEMRLDREAGEVRALVASQAA
jgi:tetratricopeptide (TPR) repeat protein